MNTLDEAQMLQRCRVGDTQAVETLVERYQGSIFRLALSILEEPDEAEEVAQDSLIAALKGLRSFQGKASFKTWLFAIAINRCRGRLRQRQRRERLGNVLNWFIQNHTATSLQLEEQVMRGERDRQIRLAVNALNEKRRLPVILRYYHELPIAEISQVLGVSERTVHNRLRAAHLELFGRLDKLERW